MTDKQLALMGHLYKMFSTKEHNYKTILEKRIFLSLPSEFNDKFDGCIRIDYLEFEKKFLIQKFKSNLKYVEIIKNVQCFESAIDRLCTRIGIEEKASYALENKLDLYQPSIDKDKLKNLVKKTYDKYAKQIDKIRNSFYVACFSKCEPQKNVSMWYFYADSYKGYCVSYSFDRVQHNLFSSRIKDSDYDYYICKNLYNVVYSDTPVSIDIDYLLSIRPKDVYGDKKIVGLVKKAFYRKKSSWKNEKEIRLIIKKEDVFMSKFSNRIEVLKNGIKIYFPFINNIHVCKLEDNESNFSKIKDVAYQLRVYLYSYCVDTAQSMLINEGDMLETNKEIHSERMMPRIR